MIVEGIVPPGAVGRRMSSRHVQEGTRFDVRVYADPRSGATSLEGGRLYTTELRPVQQGEVYPSVGSRQAAALASAGGPIFLNPFAEPGALQRDSANRTIGRIMDGGEVLKDMPIKLRLATPSHARAEILQSTINARFTQEAGQPDPTARGESDEAIRITVPPTYRNTPEDFVELLRHTTIRLSNAERVASSIKSVVMNDPSYAADASWRWQALGQRALPTTRSLYDYSEELPRLAALRAGAKLGDALVVPHLVDMAKVASPESRRQAVKLLGDMPLDPRIDLELRSLLNDEDVDVRLSAYEALALRRDPHLTRHSVDGKFLLDVIESDKPMIYITQIGKPRIAVFGEDLAIKTPLLASIWGGQIMVQAKEGDQNIEVYHRPEERAPASIHAITPGLEEFIRFLGREMSVERPAPGLDLSYGQTVGVLYQIWRQEYINADFKAEQDRVLAAILRQQTSSPIEARPEFSDPDFDFLLPQDSSSNPPTGEGSPQDQLAPPPEIGSSRNEW